MQVEVQSFNIATSDGLQTITSPALGSVVPKAVLFCIVGSDIFDDNDSTSGLGFGAVDGTRQWALYGVSEDGAGTSNSHTVASTTRCLYVLHDDDASIRGEAAFDAFVAGGVRIDWINAHFDDFKCIAIFFAGDDVSVRVDSYELGAEDVETVITAPGFQPKLVWAATRGGGAGAGVENHQRISIGAAVDDGGGGYDQRSWVMEDEDGQGTSVVEAIIYNNRVGGRGGTGGSDYSVEFDTPAANGFSSFTRGASPSSDFMFYLALDFTNPAALFSYSIPTGTGNDAKTGIGFQPIFVSLNGTSADAENTNMKGGDEANVRGFGAFTTTDEYSNSIQNEDGNGTTDTNSIPFDRALAMFREIAGGSPREPDASFVSMDADGFTLNYADAGLSPTRFAWGLAVGPEPAGGRFMAVIGEEAA